MNPVLREGISLHFVEGHLFRAYFFSLTLLASIQCLLAFLSFFDPQAWLGRAYLFHLSAVAALTLAIYLSLRVGNQEFAPRTSRTVRFWFHEEGLRFREVALGQIGLLALHSLVFVAVSFPLLLWAAAIARPGAGDVQATLLLLMFYSLVYGMWGLVASTFWQSLESRQFFTRCLFGFFVFLSGLVHWSLNPVAYLLFHLGWVDLGKPILIWGFAWSPSQVHFVVHFFLLAAALLTYLRALKREGYL